jgi:hypothetical protein
MLPKFAYSFDRETFTGSYDSRNQALAAALEHARKLGDGLSTVYVAVRVPGDPQASDHAETVIKCMARRAHQHVGDAAGGYLKRINDQQEAELDDALRDAILAWLTKHELGPTFFQIKSVSEHQIPTIKQVQCGSSDEVHELGVSEYPLG